MVAFPQNSRTDILCALRRRKTPFTCKSIATSHGKGTVDRIDGRPKSLIQQKVIRKSKDWLIVQNAEKFATAAKALMEKLRVIFVGQNEIEEFKEKMDFFQKTPAVPQVSQIHTANYDSFFIFFWNTSFKYLLYFHDSCNHNMVNYRRNESLQSNFWDSQKNQASLLPAKDDNKVFLSWCCFQKLHSLISIKVFHWGFL